MPFFCIALKYSMRKIIQKVVESIKFDFAMQKKLHIEFFETKSSFKDFTAFKEIYLMEYSIGMQKRKIWSSSMASSFKDSMTNYKFYLMEYSIIMQRKRHMDFFKQTKRKEKKVTPWHLKTFTS